MGRINISMIMYAGLSYGGAHRQVIRLACELDKSVFNVRYFWCKHNHDIGSTFVFPELYYENITLMENSGVEVIEFHVKERDVTKRFHPWLGTDFWDVYEKYPTDLVFGAKAGYPEYPFVLMKEPVIEWNVFGLVDRSKNLVCSVSQGAWVRNNWLNGGGDVGINRDIYPFVPDITENTNRREELGISNDEIVIGFHQRKDDHIYSDHALVAFSKIKHKLEKPVRFIIMGGSDKYKILAKNLGLDVIFLPIELDFKRVSHLLNTLDIFAHSGGAGEALCMAIQEAMMYGMPTVTMVISGKPDGQVSTIGDGGLVAQNVAEYSEHLYALIENEELRRLLGENAKRRAFKFYSKDASVIAFTELFQEFSKQYRGIKFSRLNREYLELNMGSTFKAMYWAHAILGKIKRSIFP